MKVGDQRFLCVPCRTDVTMKQMAYGDANRALGELDWSIAYCADRGWCLRCPKCNPAEGS